MTRKHVGRNTRNSGRINVSGFEFDKLDLEIGDAVDIGVTDASAVEHVLIDSKDSDEFLIVTPP